jgi:two-component system invasion response regulator UvrY
MNAMISVILVDDYALLRAGLHRLLSDSPDIKVVGEAEDCEKAIRLARSNGCSDIVLINVNSPSVAILDGASRLLRQCPDARVLLITSDVDLLIPSRLLRDGVAGYLTQHCTIEELRIAIRTVFQGKRYIGDALAKQLALGQFSKSEISPFEALSHREMQVLLLLAQGKKVSEISGKLFLSPKTINTYRHRLLGKLGVRTEVELAHLAIRHGVIDVRSVQ